MHSQTFHGESLIRSHFSSAKEKDQTESLQSLNDSNHVNKMAIDSFLDLIVCGNQEDSTLPAAYAMPTGFWEKLIQEGYSSAKICTEDVDLFKFHVLFSKYCPYI